MYALKFGKHKGKDLTQVPTEYLFWLVENTDLNDPKYGANNKKLVDACNEAINSRSTVQKAPRADLPTIQLQKPGKGALYASIQALIDDLYKHANEMQRLMDEHKADGSIVTTRDQHIPF